MACYAPKLPLEPGQRHVNPTLEQGLCLQNGSHKRGRDLRFSLLIRRSLKQTTTSTIILWIILLLPRPDLQL